MKIKRVITISAISVMVALLAVGGVVTATNSTVQVSPSNLNGWVETHTGCGGATGSQAFVNGPGTPPLGTGSHQFNIGADGNSFEVIRTANHNGTLLADITTLDYSTYVQVSGSGGQSPYLNLLVDTTGDGVSDDQLFFEPVYQDGNYGFLNQGTLTVGAWQDWDAVQGGWWSLNAATFGPPLTSLAAYAAANPGAKLANSTLGALRIATGCGAGAWDNFVGNADALTIGANGNSTTYDFELNTAPTTASQCKNGGWQSFNPNRPAGPFKNQGDCIQYVNTAK